MKVSTAFRWGFRITQKGLPIVAALFVLNLILSIVAAPSAKVAPTVRTGGQWSVVWVLFLVSLLGASYLWGGIQAFARDGVKEGKYTLNAFLGNCKRYFLRQLGLNLMIGVIFWFVLGIALAFAGAAVLAKANPAVTVSLGAVAAVLLILAVLLFLFFSFSWTIVVANDAKLFKAVSQSFLFVKKRFLKIVGMVGLLFVAAVAMELIFGFIYTVLGSVLKRAGVSGVETFLLEFFRSGLYAYFTLFSVSAFMAFYLNSGATAEQVGAA